MSQESFAEKRLPGADQIDFAHVDTSAHPQQFVRYLEHTRENDQLQALKQHSYAVLEASEGKRLLDVGCGIGDDVRALARIAGATGAAVGLDNSQTMIEAAQKHSEGLDHPGEFQQGDLHHLPFADASFDGCRAERVLIHSDHPDQALAEMARVVRSGGLLVVIEPDLDTVITHLSNHELARKLTQWQCDSVRNGWIGRQLAVLFRQQGLVDVQVFPTVLYFTRFTSPKSNQLLLKRAQERNLLTADEAAAVMSELHQRDAQGAYFEFGVFFMVVGRKP